MVICCFVHIAVAAVVAIGKPEHAAVATIVAVGKSEQTAGMTSSHNHFKAQKVKLGRNRTVSSWNNLA